MNMRKELSLSGTCGKSRKNCQRRICHRKRRESRQGVSGAYSEDASDNTKKKFRDMCQFLSGTFLQYRKKSRKMGISP